MEIKRIRTNAGMTQREVAAATGMTSHAVLRYEQGLYEQLSPALASYYASLEQCDTLQIEHVYHEDRINTQHRAVEHFRILPPLRLLPNEHPFETFRKAVTQRAVGKESRMAFCILLALNPAVVYTYDTGKQPTMPSLIEQGLINAGVNAAYISGLKDLGEIWYERHA